MLGFYCYDKHYESKMDEGKKFDYDLSSNSCDVEMKNINENSAMVYFIFFK